MKRLLVLVLLTQSLATFLYAGWTRYYGGSRDDYGRCVHQTANGGYIISGTTYSLSSDLPVSLWLLATDSLGDTLWTRTIASRFKTPIYTYGESVRELPEGGYILAGTTVNANLVLEIGEYSIDLNLVQKEQNLWILKTNYAGRFVWERTYMGKHKGLANFICPTSDGNYVVAGSTIDTTSRKDVQSLYMVKSSPSGDCMWHRIFSRDVSTAGYCIQETNDKGLVACGLHGDDIWLLETDSAGNVTWKRTYGGPRQDSAFSLTGTQDGGFLVAGNTRSFGQGKLDLWLLRVDSRGDTLWTRTYGGKQNDCGFSVVATSDGGAAVAGYTSSSGAGGKDLWLVRIDSKGNTLWTKTYGTKQDEEAYFIDATRDGGFILTGYRYYLGSRDLWLIKTDARGDTL